MSKGLDRKLARYINAVLVVAVIFAVYVWSTVYQNAQSSPATTTAEVDFLDVGQGDSALIKLPDSLQILIDGGEDNKAVNQLGKYMPQFDRKIEYVIASHPDSDHIGGLPAVLDSYEVGEYISNGEQSESQVVQKLQRKLDDKKITQKTVKKGDKLDFSAKASALVLNPPEGQDGLSRNDRSIVLRFEYGLSCIIFSGDAEVASQNQMAANFSAEELHCEILKFPHHGAETALNRKFLDKVKPEIAVISVGKNNSYGHPTKAVLTALKELNVQTFRTDELKTISFVFKDEKWVKK